MAEALALEPAPGLRVVWDLGAVREIAPAGAREAQSLWALEGAPEERFELLRVLSGAIGGGPVVVFAAARPRGAAGHGEELAAGAIVPQDSPPQVVEHPLLSTEYAADGSPRRITLELWLEGEDYPARGGADATAVAGGPGDGAATAGAAMRFRFEGGEGVAVYEIVRMR